MTPAAPHFGEGEMTSAEPSSKATSTPLLVVVGPTASRKTQLAMRLAELHGGEVVSADSVQVYRYFDIGSGKPSAEETARVPHHLIDVREPTEPMDASEWAAEADRVIERLRASGKPPIVCGGTYLWVRALLYGLADAPAGNEALRQDYERIAREHGRAALHHELARVDPESAARLHENDFVRVSRALEVHQLTGRRLSEIQAEHGFREPRYRARLLGIDWSREQHDRLIAGRVERMLSAGWIDEARELDRRGYGDTRPMQSVGYRQVHASLSENPPPSREELKERIVRATRLFARRQRTWLRDRRVHWLAPNQVEDAHALARVMDELERQ